MFTLGEMASAGGLIAAPQVHYIFEAGDEGRKGLMSYLNFVQGRKDLQPFLGNYSLNRWSVTGKDGMEGIFHSTDLIAWEWSKHIERRRGGFDMRKSLASLTRDAAEGEDAEGRGYTISDGKGRYFRHYSDRALQRTLTAFRGTLEASSPEAVDAAFKLWEESR